MTTPLDNPPDPLPRDHPAWQNLYERFIAACAVQPADTAAHLLEVFDSLDYFQFAIATGQVTVAPVMRHDGLYYLVSVRASDADSTHDVTRVHSANLGMTDELLAADEWVANATALAKGAPDTPEGIEGA